MIAIMEQGRRRLTVVVRTARGTLPLVVAASVAGASCSSDETGIGKSTSANPPGATGGLTTDAGPPSNTGGATEQGGALGAGGTLSTGGVTSGSGGDSFIIVPPASGGTPSDTCQFTVELPPEGVPPDPRQICSATMVPVESGRSAMVQFQSTGREPLQGVLVINPNLAVTGTPTLEVIDSTDPALRNVTFDSVTLTPMGYSFQIHWPTSLSLSPDGMTRITVRASFELPCGKETQVVHSATDIHLCTQSAYDGAEWVSSGQVCSVCRIIAEMAPSPIVPDSADDPLPLAQVLRLRIVELARVANVVVLLAENDGGAGLEYEWQASAGKIEHLAPDVVAWTLAEGLDAPSIHAAVWGPNAAAVASFAFNVEAA
jgi:hypothetical protein